MVTCFLDDLSDDVFVRWLWVSPVNQDVDGESTDVSPDGFHSEQKVQMMMIMMVYQLSHVRWSKALPDDPGGSYLTYFILSDALIIIVMMILDDNFFSFKIFCCTQVHFWGHWYPCFGLLVTSHLGFKARVGSLIHAWQRHTWCILPEINLWCDTFAGVYSQHSSRSLSPHAYFSRGRMSDLKSRPPACSRTR